MEDAQVSRGGFMTAVAAWAGVSVKVRASNDLTVSGVPPVSGASSVRAAFPDGQAAVTETTHGAPDAALCGPLQSCLIVF